MALRPLAFLVMFASVSAWGGQISITNHDFSLPAVGCGGFAYQGTDGCGADVPGQDFNSVLGFGWTLTVGVRGSGGAGITTDGTAFVPPSFSGMPFSQALFLQDVSSAFEDITGPAGLWTISFYLGSRYAEGSGDQTVDVLLDSEVIGTFVVTTGTPFTLETVSVFVPSAGSHTLTFAGTQSGDRTVFLSDVNGFSVPEPGTMMLLGASLGGLAFLRRRR